LNQGTKTTYLNQGGAKLPHIPKILKNAYMSMKLTQNEVINRKVWNQIMWLSISLGQKSKTLYLLNNLSYRICSYFVGKHLQRSKRWLIIGMDISVPDRKISMLNSNKIPKNWKNQNSLWGVQKFQFLEIDLFFIKGL